MKLFLTVVLFLFLSVAYSQDKPVQQKVDTIEKGIVTDTNTDEVARLYRRKNSRVKKALSFTTKRNRSKLA